MLYALLAAALMAPSLSTAPSPVVASEASSPSLRGFRLVAATERIDYFAMNDSPARADDARKVERMLEDLERRMGQRAPERVSYYRVTYAADMERITGQPWAGVTDQHGHRVVSSVAVHAHELVHAIALQLGDPGRFFHEGLAVALSEEPAWRGKKLEELARAGLRRRALTGYAARFEEGPTEYAYAVAGVFVERLIKQYGLPKVLEFFRGCSSCPRDEMFQRTFGVTIADAGVKWSGELSN